MQSCASANYFAQTNFTDGRIIIKKTEFVTENKKVHRKFVLVRSEKYNYPICIYKTGKENYSALLMLCTHNGCELQPHGDFLLCPCHGSEFTNKGVVQNPPADQNLKTFSIVTDDENVYVQL